MDLNLTGELRLPFKDRTAVVTFKWPTFRSRSYLKVDDAVRAKVRAGLDLIPEDDEKYAIAMETGVLRHVESVSGLEDLGIKEPQDLFSTPHDTTAIVAGVWVRLLQGPDWAEKKTPSLKLQTSGRRVGPQVKSSKSKGMTGST